MNPENLAPIYLDNQPITLKDPKPKLSAVLSASGKTDVTDVKWLQFQPNTPGKTLRAEEVLDRTSEPNKPIYLTSNKSQSGQSHGGQPQTGQNQGGQSQGARSGQSQGQSSHGSQGGMEAGKGRDPNRGAEARSERAGAHKSTGAEEDTDEESGESDVRGQGEKQGGREFGQKSRDE